ncbi:hypothetical protein HMPREF1544_08009 [Mucor circinelloides 1006PhL]|uniref:Uncharacterized protein n=1 Tax=Mucor circinelloides f. circinelloides (strain 1006PhL) TaxID=1220926 RepID=S2J9X7_MUCC1|nr:hypothetical protein HMPREF1544_08009 [Mucor circinelloides 1006PhL]
MSSNEEIPDDTGHSALPKAVSLTKSRSNTSQQPSAIAHAPAFDQFNDKLFKSIQQCIDTALEPLVQRMADIEKAMIVRTASIAEQVSTVSINQQVLHKSLLDIVERIDQLQFEEQSVYTDDESLSSFDIPAKRSSRNADGVSVCSTEASECLSSSDEEDNDSVCTETTETLNEFQIPEASFTNAERYNQFTRIESRKYTAKFNNASSSSPIGQTHTVNSSNSDRQVEHREQPVSNPPQIVPGIPVVPQTATLTNATIVSTHNSMPANTPTLSPASNQTKSPVPSIAPLLKKEPVLTTAPVSRKAQPITIAPITASIPIPSPVVATAEPLSITTTPEASSELTASTSGPASASASSSVTTPQVDTERNILLRSNQRRNKREPIGKKFTYVYFKHDSRSRSKCKDVRTELIGIGIQQRKLLDIYFPGKGMAAVLYPDIYLAEAIDIMEENNFTIVTNFNPLDSKNLGDPKYKNLSMEERNEIIRRLHENQMRRALDRIKDYSTQLRISHDFANKGWISQATLIEYASRMFKTS